MKVDMIDHCINIFHMLEMDQGQFTELYKFKTFQKRRIV